MAGVGTAISLLQKVVSKAIELHKFYSGRDGELNTFAKCVSTPVPNSALLERKISRSSSPQPPAGPCSLSRPDLVNIMIDAD
jgi:hypothetical protein